MLNVTDLIHDLTAATDQMKQAALADDWIFAGKIQKQRALLIGRIVEYANATALTEEEILALNAVRAQEAIIVARAGARHQALGHALAKTRTGEQTGKHKRMRKAYSH